MLERAAAIGHWLLAKDERKNKQKKSQFIETSCIKCEIKKTFQHPSVILLCQSNTEEN